MKKRISDALTQAIETATRQHLDHWRALLTKHVADGRRLLREVLAGPLQFMPEGKLIGLEVRLRSDD